MSIFDLTLDLTGAEDQNTVCNGGQKELISFYFDLDEAKDCARPRPATNQNGKVESRVMTQKTIKAASQIISF